jgi:ubiquinone/menaquinone biosynthesis C-methylase UbiE
MDVIGVKEGMKIGVAGAGHGYFTFKMAERVGETGWVYANEIDEDCIQYIKNKCRRNNVNNVSTILGEVADPLFPRGQMDMVFMCYVFHDLEKPVEFMKNIVPSLKPGGTVVILDQDPGKTGSHHFLTKAELLSKVKRAGYEVVKIETFLRQDNIYICRTLGQ